jgi:hypothetical protein
VQDGKEWQKKEYIINKDTFILNKKIVTVHELLDLFKNSYFPVKILSKGRIFTVSWAKKYRNCR